MFSNDYSARKYKNKVVFEIATDFELLIKKYKKGKEELSSRFAIIFWYFERDYVNNKNKNIIFKQIYCWNFMAGILWKCQ